MYALRAASKYIALISLAFRTDNIWLWTMDASEAKHKPL
jgi:hypothetical protein